VPPPQIRVPLARLEARIDLDAVRSNVRRMREIAAPAAVMAVVKADAYGHGMVECARAAVEAGAAWLGTALPEEALALRAAGLEAPILTWLHAPGDDFAGPDRAADVDVSVSGQWALHAILERPSRPRPGVPARIQLKADTGLGRNGVQPHDWPLMVDEAVKAERRRAGHGHRDLVPLRLRRRAGAPLERTAADAFHEALAVAEAAGLRPEVRHMANSPAALLLPESRFDLVRCGLSMYGLPGARTRQPAGLRAAPGDDPGRPAGLGQAGPGRARGLLRPHVPHRRPDPAGSPWSRPDTPTGSRAPPPGSARSGSAGRRHTVAGRVAMDQFVVDLGDQEAAPEPEPRATRCCSSAPATGRPPPPRTGPRRPAPSPTRSSPGSDRACRACTPARQSPLDRFATTWPRTLEAGLTGNTKQ
jgi:alanine racemase